MISRSQLHKTQLCRMFTTVNMRTVAIVSQKGGAGKTTLAIHLAAAALVDRMTPLIIDTDPQATASTWGQWRKGAPPEVIDSAPARVADKIEKASAMGADLVIIDTPPHADASATKAAQAADLILIPCRPNAFDLDAIQATARLVSLLQKPAFVVFMAGPGRAPKLYEEAGEVVANLGLSVAPHIISDRAAFRHATAEGRTAIETEPHGKAAEEIRSLYMWICEQLHMPQRETVGTR